MQLFLYLFLRVWCASDGREERYEGQVFQELFEPWMPRSAMLTENATAGVVFHHADRFRSCCAVLTKAMFQKFVPPPPVPAAVAPIIPPMSFVDNGPIIAAVLAQAAQALPTPKDPRLVEKREKN
jgi:hypothetical protein